LCTTISAQASVLPFSDREYVAMLLIKQYPFLKGSFGTGHQIWSKKIMNRMANLNKRANKQGKQLFQSEGEPATSSAAKGKPGRKKQVLAANIIPGIPDGETVDTLQDQKQQIQQKCREGSPDLSTIRMLMDATFPLRRREILTNNLRVWKLLKEYPPLENGNGNEIRAELQRILGEADCCKSMKYAFLDTWKPKLLMLLKNSSIREVKTMLHTLEDGEFADEKEMENRCIMAALPHILVQKKSPKQQPGVHFWKFVPNDSEEDSEKEVEATTAPRLISTGATFDDVQSLVLAAEGMVVCHFKQLNILTAVITLIASYYVFNADYPKGLGGHSKNIYLFLEHMLLPKLRHGSTAQLPISVETVIGKLNGMA